MRWVLNIASNYLRFLAGMVLVFFLTPYIVARIGVDLFGLWTLVFAVVGLFGLLDLGFATAAVKYMAEKTAAGDLDGRNQVLATLLLVYSALGLLCLALVAGLAETASRWFDLGPAEQADFAAALWLVGTAVALGFPLNLFKAILTGGGHMALVNGVELVASLLNAALVVALLETGHGLLGLAAASTASMLLAGFAMVPLARRLTPGLSLAPRHFAPERVRELAGFSVWFFIANVAVLVILRIDPLVIKAFLPLSAVAVYAVAAKVAEYTHLLNKQFSNALMPLVSQSRGAGDDAMVRRVLVDGTRFLLGIALPFVALLFFHAETILLAWMGPQFAGAVPLLRILLLAVLASSLQLNAANVLGMSGHHRFVALAMGASALFNLALSVVLIQVVGLTGVAVATLAAALAVESLVILPRACARQGVTFAGFLRAAVLPSLSGLVPALGLAFILARVQPPAGFGAVVLQGGLCALVYFAGFWLTGLTAAERRTVTQRLRRPRPANAEESP